MELLIPAPARSSSGLLICLVIVNSAHFYGHLVILLAHSFVFLLPSFFILCHLDGPTDGRTPYRDATAHLKIVSFVETKDALTAL